MSLRSKDSTPGAASRARSVTIVVVTFNAADHLGALLASIEAAATRRRVSVVVVDNGSTDGTLERLRGVPDVNVIAQHNTGFAHGVNRGIEVATDVDDVLLLNPDVVLEPDVIERLCDVLDEHPSVGIVVPQLQDELGKPLPSLRRAPTVFGTLVEAVVGGTRAGRFSEGYVPGTTAQRQSVIWATGAALLLRRELVASIGLLDESFFLYSEETEYCLRAREAGWEIVCEPRAIAHHVGGDMSRNPELWALRAVNRVRLYQRRSGRGAAVSFRLVSILFELRRALSGSRVSRAALQALVAQDLDATARSLFRSVGGVPVGQR